MEIGDLREVFIMGADAFRSVNELRFYDRWNEEALADLFARFPEYALTASRKKQVLGFALGGVIQEQSGAGTGYILWSAVRDRDRFRGLRERLLDELFNSMLGGGMKTILCMDGIGDEEVGVWCGARGFVPLETGSVMKWVRVTNSIG